MHMSLLVEDVLRLGRKIEPFFLTYSPINVFGPFRLFLQSFALSDPCVFSSKKEKITYENKNQISHSNNFFLSKKFYANKREIKIGVTILLAFFVNSLVVSNYTPEAASGTKYTKFVFIFLFF